MATSPDYYETLGIARDASNDDIKKAYRKLAHKYHPDKGGTKGDEAKFREVNEAYQILSDPQKRQAYDQYGAAGPAGGTGGGGAGQGFGGAGFEGFAGGFDNFGDIFEQFFSGGAGTTTRGPARGADLEMGLKITFAEAVSGTNKRVNVQRRVVCVTCSGNGADPGSKIATCSRCGGAGEIRMTRQTILGAMQQVTACPACRGEGKIPEKPCHACGGEGRVQKSETLSIDIPAGIDDGQTIRLPNQGEAGERGASSGHLYVTVQVEPSKTFRREGADVHLTVPVSYPQAALGAEIEVPTLRGKTKLKVPAGSPSGKSFRLKGEGMNRLGATTRGDEVVTVEIEVPNKLTDQERRLIEELARTSGETPAQKKSWFDKLGL